MSNRDRGDIEDGIGSGTNHTSMRQAAIEQWGEDWHVEDVQSGSISIQRQGEGINFSDLFLVSKNRVTLANDIKIDEYWAFFDGVFEIIEQAQWVIADMTAGGEDKLNVSYNDVADRYNMKPETVRQYAYVSRNVSIRLDELSFSHHHTVVNMSPAQQKKWLNKALENKWSVKELRRQIKGESLPATVSILADKTNRNRMNRIWRAVQAGDFDKLKREDVDASIAWLKEVRGKI